MQQEGMARNSPSTREGEFVQIGDKHEIESSVVRAARHQAYANRVNAKAISKVKSIG